MKCYPDFVTGFSDNHLIFKDSSRLLWDDGIKNKSFKTLLDNPDVKDMFSLEYVAEALKSAPSVNADPGRIRNEAFFLEMYGATEKQAKQHLTEITRVPKIDWANDQCNPGQWCRQKADPNIKRTG